MKSNDWEELELNKEMSLAEWEQLTDIISRISLPGPEGFVEEAVRRYSHKYRDDAGETGIDRNDRVLLNHIKTQLFKGEENMGKEKKSSGKLFDRELSRRTFLKGAAATAAVAGVAVSGGTKLLSPLANAAGEGETHADREYGVVCRSNCQGGCYLTATVRNEKLVKTEMRELPDSAYNRVCLKGLTHVQRIYDPNRLKKPLRRVGERGEGKWEEITWDAAIEEICSKWKSYREQYGDSSVMFCELFGQFGTSAYNCAVRLKNVMNASGYGQNMDAAFYYGCGNAIGYGSFINANEPKDLRNAKCVIVWGANPTETQPHNWQFIMDAVQKNGAKLIVINPNFNTAAAKADYFVPVKPGTDAILAMAMMNIIIKQEWQDWDFLKKSSVGPFWVKESDGRYLRISDLRALQVGEEDAILVRDADGKFDLPGAIANPVMEGSGTIIGVGGEIKVTTAYSLLLKAIEKYTLSYAATACGLSESLIFEITEIFAKQTPGSIYIGYGPDHYWNGHWTMFTFMALDALVGNLGRSGSIGGDPLGSGVAINPEGSKPNGSVTQSPTINHMEILDVLETGKTGNTSITLKSMYIYAANLIGAAPDRQAWLDAIKSLDLIVVADMVMSDTAMYADIVLPVCHWFEYFEVHSFNTQNPHVLISERAIKPLYESKSDWDIVCLLGKGMGYGEYFDMTIEEYLKLLLDTDALSWERIVQEKAIRFLPGDLYIHGEGGVFPTATGRAQFYQEDPYPNGGYYGQEAHKAEADPSRNFDLSKERLPYWEPPIEVYDDNPRRQQYPLVYFTEHTRWRIHTQWGLGVPWLREIDTEPVVKINPVDAEARGIQHGDIVKIYNDRGYVLIKAVISDSMQPGSVNIPKGWQRDQFIEGHYQDVTHNYTNPFCANCLYFDVLVEAELYKGGNN